jgi:hypothetical protein
MTPLTRWLRKVLTGSLFGTQDKRYRVHAYVFRLDLQQNFRAVLANGIFTHPKKAMWIVPSMRIAFLLVQPIQFVFALNTSTPGAPSYQKLTFGAWTPGIVESGSWVDYYAVAVSDDESIEFEVVAQSGSVAALSIYVNDGDIGPAQLGDSGEVTTVSVDLHAAEAQRRLGVSAASLDASWVSPIGNETHRHFYASVSPCYAMKGKYYFLSVYGSTWSTVAFQVRATHTSARLIIAPQGSSSTSTFGSKSGRVCDGKYAHMFFDLPNRPSHGGISFAVEKRSGALDEWYLRYERCAGPTGNLFKGNLFGHGLTTSSYVLPRGDTRLEAGRYYVSVRASLDMCGEFIIKLANLTSSQLALFSDEV